MENDPSPIHASVGEYQYEVDPKQLKPSRNDLIASRLALQQSLVATSTSRYTPILVTMEGVIVDGHHAVRLAAEQGRKVDVKVSAYPVKRTPFGILDLPVR